MDNSAKVIDDNEITPQSNYVFVYPDGKCVWEPRYELSVTQCPVDVTWFPFDDQVCNLTFQSWLLRETSLNLRTDNGSVSLVQLIPPDAWHITGTFGSWVLWWERGGATPQ